MIQQERLSDEEIAQVRADFAEAMAECKAILDREGVKLHPRVAAILAGTPYWPPVVKRVIGLSLAIVALSAMLVVLAGCTTTGVPVVPAQLLTCTPQPPSPKAGTQRDVALYVIDLAAAGADCRSKLGSVRRILTPENK